MKKYLKIIRKNKEIQMYQINEKDLGFLVEFKEFLIKERKLINLNYSRSASSVSFTTSNHKKFKAVIFGDDKTIDSTIDRIDNYIGQM